MPVILAFGKLEDNLGYVVSSRHHERQSDTTSFKKANKEMQSLLLNVSLREILLGVNDSASTPRHLRPRGNHSIILKSVSLKKVMQSYRKDAGLTGRHSHCSTLG